MPWILRRCLGLLVPGLMVIALSLSVSACGKRGNPKPAESKPAASAKIIPTK